MEIPRGSLELAGMLRFQPYEARKVLLANPELKEEYRTHFERYASFAIHDTPDLDGFYRQFLTPMPEEPTLLFIATGTGAELVVARHTFPDARIIGVEKDVDACTISTEIVSGAEFIQADLTQISPTKLLEKVGVTPDWIICRHPNVVTDIWFGPYLAVLAKLVSGQSRMLITNLHQMEKDRVNHYLQVQGVSYKSAERMGSDHHFRNGLGPTGKDSLITLIST